MSFVDIQKSLYEYICKKNVSDDAMLRMVRPSSTLSGDQRARIYRTMYRLRMVEALQEDFPLCWALLGEDPAEELAMEYVARHPSHSFTLNVLGHSFAQFLAERKDLPPYFFDIARVEWALVEAFHSTDAKPSPWKEGLLQDEKFWENTRLSLSPSTRLLQLQYNVDASLDSLQNDVKAAPPENCPQNMAIFKHRDDPYRMVLSDGAFSLLSQLDGEAPLCLHIDRLLQDPRFVDHVRSIPEELEECLRMGVVQG